MSGRQSGAAHAGLGHALVVRQRLRRRVGARVGDTESVEQRWHGHRTAIDTGNRFDEIENDLGPGDRQLMLQLTEITAHRQTVRVHTHGAQRTHHLEGLDERVLGLRRRLRRHRIVKYEYAH